MITCEVRGHGPANGGLGNQMFCVAATLGAAYKNGTVAVFPDLNKEPYKFYGDTIFHSLNKGGNIDFFTNVHREPPYTSTVYHDIPFMDGMKLSGHFQSYKYFDFCRGLIVDSFKLPASMAKEMDDKYGGLVAPPAVSVHVRRGDYISLQGNYEVLGADYYRKALAMFDKPHKVIVFSDDPQWCKSALEFDSEDEVHYIEGEDDVCDLYLMSKVKNNIISNSTFSWWAAYLNENKDKKIVGPRKWFGPKRTKDNNIETKDLFPKEWTRI